MLFTGIIGNYKSFINTKGEKDKTYDIRIEIQQFLIQNELTRGNPIKKTYQAQTNCQMYRFDHYLRADSVFLLEQDLKASVISWVFQLTDLKVIKLISKCDYNS